jgi:hypothetical protein
MQFNGTKFEVMRYKVDTETGMPHRYLAQKLRSNLFVNSES